MPVEKTKLPDGRTVNTSDRFELARPFANKFWNAARLVLMNLEGYDPAKLPAGDFLVNSSADSWILGRLHTVADETTDALDRFAFADAARTPPRLHLERLLRLVPRIRQGRPPRTKIRPIA